MNKRYQIYSDESGHERFRSIGVLSGEKTDIDKYRRIRNYLKNKAGQKDCW
jgi:hypothetical protein